MRLIQHRGSLNELRPRGPAGKAPYSPLTFQPCSPAGNGGLQKQARVNLYRVQPPW